MALTVPMTFAWPHLLWLLVLPAGLLAWELKRARRSAGALHPKILRAEAGLRSVTLTEDAGGRSHLARRRFLLCAGIALSIVALARPQWGRVDEPVFDQSRDIVIALDLSRSMLTPDVKPSRLERAKLLVQSLLDKLKGERVGLVVFSGTAFLQSPLSSDYEILREFLPSLGPDFMPEGGTNYAQLLDTSLDAFSADSAADRYLIILSDGEATDDEWRDRIPALKKRGIRVIGLGVGTDAGGMIPDGAGDFMKDENGAVVLSKLESNTLRELAKATNGVYKDASEWVDLSKVLESTVAEGRKGRFVEHNNVRYAERYQWALAQALVCFLASFWLEFPVRPKSRDIRLSAPGPRPAPGGAAKAAAALAAVLILLVGARAAEAPPPDNAAALSKVIGRISAQDSASPLDWAEMGNETLTWGRHVKGEGQSVPEQPVRDALRAVDEGERGDPKAADWPRMRSELNELLKKPENKKQDQKNQQNQQNQQNKQDQKDQKDQQDKKDEQQKEQKQDQQKQQQSGGGQQRQGQQNQEQGQKQDQRQQQNRKSAFGDMGRPTPTPQPRREQGAMQKVGGARQDDANDPARANPELAVPLEKLEQLRNADSPAQLFEMLRKGEPTPQPTPGGKNW